MADGTTPIKYNVRFEKDGTNVKATYGLRVPVGGPALIADFQLAIDGKDLVSNFISGQVQFNGIRYHVLAHPDQDAPVSFSMASNQGWTAGDSGVLRGDRRYDDAEFSD